MQNEVNLKKTKIDEIKSNASNASNKSNKHQLKNNELNK